ncbi:MAG: T9SS type A sorting domain-containing protein [Bacteroidetes bacterium]|nr:T9SS type A sorting domain-containing protein [Bacteroidota bacterium]
MQTNLTSLNDSLNYGNYRDALTSYIDLIEEDSSVMKLASAHIETLNERAMENEHLRGSMYARNLLNFFYDSTYFTPPYLPENAPGWSGKRGSEPDEVRKSVEPGKKFKTLPVLKIYPNPAKEFVIVEYEGFEEGGTVQVMDVYGRLLSVIHTKAENEKVEINTSGFNSGIYLVSVMVDRTMKDKGKFNIVK